MVPQGHHASVRTSLVTSTWKRDPPNSVDIGHLNFTLAKVIEYETTWVYSLKFHILY